MGRLVYLTRNYKGTRNGGAKARVDIEDILAQEGAVRLGLPRSFHSNKFVDFLRNLTGILAFARSIKRGDILVLQYPLKKYFETVCDIARKRGATTVTLIHDLGSFRRHRLTPEQEIKRLNHTDMVIAANENTTAWLRAHSYTKPIAEQIAWDYLSPAHPGEPDSDPTSVTFVGDLQPRRNAYLSKLPTALTVHLYGRGAPDTFPRHIHNHGFAYPDEIISRAPGRYGLIWYGSTLTHDPDGYIGDYIRYCNSHKLGLYLLAAKPVIIWRHAAAAKFIEKEGIGITVESLEDLDSTLRSISEEDYRQMRANTQRVAEKIRKGEYILAALKRLGIKA